jgi:lysophospholipid acyltransferase (LPLAT)-like uncharacterized protein
MKTGLGRRISLYFVPLICAPLVKIWYLTCKVRLHNIAWRKEAEQSGKPIIRTCWHYCVLGLFAVYTNNPLVIMVSASNDGDYLARLIEKLGFSAVRGSSNRRGAKAAIELIRELRSGKHCGLVADGSQGPARRAQAGPLLLAGKSGGMVLPMVYSVSSYITFKTWDRLILPKPFSTIDVVYGKPFLVPKEVKAGDLGGYRSKLENCLNALYEEAWSLHGKKGH